MIYWLKTVILSTTLIGAVLISAFDHPFSFHELRVLTSPKLPMAQQIELPQVEAVYQLGVPVGNATLPWRLALNGPAGQLYIFSETVSQAGPGNGLTVYDIRTKRFVQQAATNQGEHEPLDLQFEAEADLIYALWRPRFGEGGPTLTAVDPQSLQPIQEVAGVEAMAAENGRLYTANSEQVTVFEVSNGSLVEIQRIQLNPAETGPLAVSPAANRLYVARASGGIWQVETFDLETLSQVGSYPTENPVLNLLPRADGNEVFVVVAQADFRVLYRLTSEGELADLPYELGPRFGAAGIALDGQNLFFSNGQSAAPDGSVGPALVGLAISNMAPLVELPLPANLEDIVIDQAGQQAFGLYPFADQLYAIDLKTETVEIINTAIMLKDVLVDEQNGHIFVSDTANRIRQFSPAMELLNETTLTGNMSDYGFNSATWSGELALDSERQRLYVSSLPAVVLEAGALAEIAAIEPGGQLEPDPTTNKIYMSNCGVTILEAETYKAESVIPESGQRPDGLSPNPCVTYSQLDPAHQLLYGITPNGTPGSNSGNYLYVYDLTGQPTLVFTDTNISIVNVEPDPAGQRAFASYLRFSNRRILSLDMAAQPPRYVDHLMGIWGDIRYSPTTNRLYLNDRDYPRLLTLAANTLDVIGETPLPQDDHYQLKAFDPGQERLYFIGSKGQLLVMSNSLSNEQIKVEAAPPQEPDGAILAIASRAQATLARIEASYDEYSVEPRLYSTVNQGQAWIDLSQNLPALPVQAMAVSPNYQTDQTLFAAVLGFDETGGLYKSTNGGQSWQGAMAGLQDLWVDALFISPDFSQNRLIFAKTRYAGLHYSNDGGQSWLPVAPLDPNYLFPTSNQAGMVAFSRNGVILISQSLPGASGLFRATLGADGVLSTWQQIFDLSMSQLGLSPDGQVAIGFDNNGLWRSADGGTTWEAGGAGLTNLDNLQPYWVLFSPGFAQDQTIYLFFSNAAGDMPGRLYRSTDAGQHWQPWLEPAGGASFTSVTLTDEGNFLFGNQAAQLIQLSPAELDWQVAETPAMPFLIDDLAASPNYEVDQTLFALSGQYGLYKSSDGGQSWRLTDFPVRTSGSSLKKPELAFSPAYAQDQALYLATGRSLHRSRDGGEHWEQLYRIEADRSGQKLNIQAQQVALSPDFERDQTVLASTAAAIYRSTDGGSTWQEVLNPAAEASTSDILTFGATGQTAYARFGYSYGLFVSNDGGQSWQELSSNRDALFSVTAAATALDGRLTVALEFDKRLLQAGGQMQPWQDISQALPETLAAISAVDYGPSGDIFIGGPGGLFKSMNNGQSWQALPISQLSSETAIADLEIVGPRLFIATTTGQIFTSPDGGYSWLDISIIK